MIIMKYIIILYHYNYYYKASIEIIFFGSKHTVKVIMCFHHLIMLVSLDQYRPSPILLSCGIAPDVAINALRISVGRETTIDDIETFIQDLSQAIASLKTS